MMRNAILLRSVYGLSSKREFESLTKTNVINAMDQKDTLYGEYIHFYSCILVIQCTEKKHECNWHIETHDLTFNSRSCISSKSTATLTSLLTPTWPRLCSATSTNCLQLSNNSLLPWLQSNTLFLITTTTRISWISCRQNAIIEQQLMFHGQSHYTVLDKLHCNYNTKMSRFPKNCNTFRPKQIIKVIGFV